LASVIAEDRQPRRLIGDTKFGLTLSLHQAPNAMRLSARPDPMLLYVVLGTATAIGIAGTILTSFEASAVGLVVLALLFSPVVCLLAWHNLRVRTTCVLDRDSGTLEIDEQSYTRRVRESYPLQEVSAVAVRAMPDAPLLGSALSFGLFFIMPQVAYLAACSNNEAALSQDAWRVSRFLGVELETPLGVEPMYRNRVSLGLMLVTFGLYLVPTLLTITALIIVFERLPDIEPSLLGLVGAIIVSQVGAILAFAYYRARRPYET
jgi:hypothetical protein